MHRVLNPTTRVPGSVGPVATPVALCLSNFKFPGPDPVVLPLWHPRGRIIYLSSVLIYCCPHWSSQQFMPSRAAYVSLTPELADFSHLRQITPEVSLASGDDQLEEPQSRWNAAFYSMRAALNNNVGLLQVVTAQVFFSLMNSSVKILNTIDPPVSTIQVCSCHPNQHMDAHKHLMTYRD